MPHRFPIDYPFGSRHIVLNGIVAAVLLMSIGIAIGSIIVRIFI